MKLFDVKVGSMHYGIAIGISKEAVQDYYNALHTVDFSIEEITDTSVLPNVMEIKITQAIKEKYK